MATDSQQSFTLSDLTCEYLVNPLGIDTVQPRLAWRMQSDQRGKRQVAYRILAASEAGLLESGETDIWDSGWIEGSQSTQIACEGKALTSRANVYWRVVVRDETGLEVASGPAFFSIGLLETSDWNTDWIGLNPEAIARDKEASPSDWTTCSSPGYFRKNITASARPKRAILYASGRGLLRLRINRTEVTEDRFLPEWTDYRKRIHYRTFDVTSLLQEGENVLAAILGDGWFSGYVGWQETRGQYGLTNSFICQLELEMDDGTVTTVSTDSSWRCNTGPILFSDFMMGETCDNRRQVEGWDQPQFDEQDWLPVLEVDQPDVPLVAQQSQPVRVIKELEPVSIRQTGEDTWLCDLGQNIAGWMRIRVDEPAGKSIVLRHGERLKADGSLFTENLRRARATDTYICDGQGPATWEPSFTFHGFQYFEISGLSKAPSSGDLTACVVQSATPQSGSFSCSHEGVNRLWLNGLWSQIDNFLSVPTDCPQRDERLGWMGDAQVFIRTAAFNMDVAAFFTKWMVDVEDAQTENGIFPDTAPRLPEDGNFIGLDGLGGSPGWADAGVIIPWTIWKVYGDRRIIERHWNAMTAWLDYIERTNPDGLRINELANNYGDWLSIPSDTTFRTHSPLKNLLATAFWADDASKMAEMARELGREEEAVRFEQTFTRVRDAFQEAYVRPDGSLEVDTQTAYLLALAMDLLPAELRAKAVGHLVDNIRSLDKHLSTGFIGIRFLNPILTDYGHADLAYELLLKDDYPSWLYPVRHGATTIWERWNAWTEEDGFLDAHMNSFNHYSLGSIGEWLYSHVAGINYKPNEPGFQTFILKPHPHPSLQWAEGEYTSPYGRIRSHWRYVEDTLLEWSVEIPANSSADVCFPWGTAELITESGQPLKDDAEGKVTEQADGGLTVHLPSGHYTFRIPCEPDHPDKNHEPHISHLLD
ncbi:MAG: family 78 glycoside hydrolase catalytic domain [Puniceicoccaceae bacterium]